MSKKKHHRVRLLMDGNVVGERLVDPYRRNEEIVTFDEPVEADAIAFKPAGIIQRIKSLIDRTV